MSQASSAQVSRVDSVHSGSAPADSVQGDQSGFHTPVFARVLQVLLCVGTLVYVVWLLTGPTGRVDARDAYLSVGLILIASAVVFTRVYCWQEGRWAWALFALALLGWAIADVLYQMWLSFLDPIPYPTIVDLLYISFGLLLIATIITLLVNGVGRPPLSVWLDALLVALATAAYVWIAVGFIIGDASGSKLSEVVVNITYPILDLVLLCLLLGTFAFLRWSVDARWWLLGIGCVIFAVTDTIYLLELTTGSYTQGTALDAGWRVGIAAMAMASWIRPGRIVTSALGLRVLIIPMVVFFATLALLIWATAHSIPAASVWLAAAALVVGAVRAAESLRRASLQAEIRRRVQTDELTGIGNRRWLNSRLDDALAGTAEGERCALIVVNIDDFTEVNDALGEARGDVLLRRLAPRIEGVAGASSTVARIGPDEFAVLIPSDVSRERAEQVAHSIAEVAARPFAMASSSAQLIITVSVGVAFVPDDSGTREELLNDAGVAMKRAKRTRAGVAVYDELQDGNDRRMLMLVQDLREAIQTDQLVCHFQPKLDLTTGDVHEAEALVRWQHPEQGLMYPDSFIGAAERAGLMDHLTVKILDVAMSQVAQWQRCGIYMTVAVNLSMTSLLDDTLPATVAATLSRYDLAPTTLVLEVTETVFMADPGHVQVVVNQLRNLGVQLSIDDYGHAYSSLGQLSALQASEIKLDRTFVTGLGGSDKLRSIVQSTIELAHNLGLRIVAEGVETGEDLAELQALGCDVGQGYYICRPGPADVITEWLLNRPSLITKSPIKSRT